MKKRNRPILLATLLVVFVAAAVGMNVIMSPKSAADLQAEAAEQQKEQEEQKTLGAPRETDNKSATQNAASVMARKRAAMGEAPNAPTSIKKGSTSVPKPKPNASMTSGQWYTDEYGYKGGDK
jgi:hypothetical protein